MMSYGREYPFGELNSAVPVISPPNFLHPELTCWQGSVRKKRRWPCLSVTQQQIKHRCAINGFHHKSKTYKRDTRCLEEN